MHMLHPLLVNGLVEKQLDEEHVEGAVEDRGQRGDKVNWAEVLPLGIWKDWEGAREGGKYKVEEETEAKETDVESVTVWAVVPWEVPDFEEANTNCDNSSQVQDAVLNLKVCILMSLINILKRPSLSLLLLHGCNPYPVSVSGKLRFRDCRELSGRPQVLRCGNFQN